ncbi:MAG: hypothetical protein ACTHJG_10730 [Rhodanobacteraceae bacterium]
MCEGAGAEVTNGVSGEKTMKRLPNPTLDVEKELSVAVRRVGGIRVDELTGKKPGHRIADFLFDNFGVIAELKCLVKDQVNDRSFIEKTSKLYQAEQSLDRNLPRIYGTVRLSSDRLSLEAQERMASLYTSPIRRVISSADEQISETKNKLGKTGYKGVLFLVNDGNTALNPSNIIWVLERCLGGDGFKNINHAIFMTVNMPVQTSKENMPESIDEETDMHVWYSAGRSMFEHVSDDFEESVRGAWLCHLDSLLGHSQSFDADPGLLEKLENSPRGRNR